VCVWRPAHPVTHTVCVCLVLRGDVARLSRCTAIQTDGEGTIPRCKPFKYTYEKEIVLYAYFRKLEYFSTECVYAPNAYRGYARSYLKDLEAVRPSAIIGPYHRSVYM
jgi:cytoplasmic tRNA 2-thiolation protein 1